MRGTRGDDELVGDGGDDEIFGLAGWDLIEGRGGDDLLDGGSGEDIIEGGSGSDSIWGGRGQDFLDGGKGPDDFWFNTKHSFDTVNDFHENDTLVIDEERGGFRGTDRGDVDIDHGSRLDRVYIEDDLIAKVFGDRVNLNDIDFV